MLELAATVFLWQASLGIFMLTLVQNYLPQQLNASTAFPGYALASYSLARFLWQMPAGWLADRFGRRLVLAIGIAVGIPVLGAMMLFPSGHLFLVFSGLYGLAAATMWPAFLAHVGDTNEPSQRGRVMYWLNIAQMLGLGAGVVVGMLLGDFVSYTAVFLACLALHGLALAVALRPVDGPVFIEPKKAAEKFQMRAFAKILKPRILILGGITLFLSLGIAVFTPTVGTYVKDVLHVQMSEMALLLVLPAGVAAAIAFRFSRLADRFGRQLPLLVGLVVTALSLFALTLTHSPFIAVNLAVLAGLAYAVSVPAWCAAALDATQVHSRGLLLGALAAVQGLGGALGQAAGGRVGEVYGPVAPFKFAAVLLGVAILLTLVYAQHQRMKGDLLPLPPANDSPLP
ncbi:MAG TPA: MFS transporter [Dehalococcoidia bacterium]|nr:MFS transporter [Dehalococcoidia bacterium]